MSHNKTNPASRKAAAKVKKKREKKKDSLSQSENYGSSFSNEPGTIHSVDGVTIPCAKDTSKKE